MARGSWCTPSSGWSCQAMILLLWSTRYGRIWLALAPGLALCYGTLFLCYHSEYVIQAMDLMEIPPFYMANVTCHGCNNFTCDYLLQPEGGGESPCHPFLLFLVTSAPENAAARQAIRETWGNVSEHRGFSVQTYFVLGRGKPKLDAQVSKEEDLHHDILQLDLNDTFRSLSNKTMGALRWALDFCPGAQYIVKTDDDSLNVPHRYVDYLLGQENEPHLIACERVLGHWPQRTHERRRVSPEEYPDSFYPPHCKGRAYVLSRSAAVALVQSAPHVRYHPVEDVYVTGLCRVPTGIPCTALNEVGMPGTQVAKRDCELASGVLNAHFIEAKDMRRLYHGKAMNQTLEEQCRSMVAIPCGERCIRTLSRGSLLFMSVAILFVWYKKNRNDLLAMAVVSNGASNAATSNGHKMDI